MQKRDSGIDSLKTIAIISVVIIHVAASGCVLPVGTFDWYVSVFWGSLARFAVPVFFMCSGCLLLAPEKELTLKKLWSKNMIKIVGALFLWATIYKFTGLVARESLNGKEALKALGEILLFDHEFHLYYLHIMILVYALLPITRLLTCKAEKRELEYFLLFWAFSGIIFPTIIIWEPFKSLSVFPRQWQLNMSYGAIGYTVLGYYLKKYPLNKKKAAAIFAAGFLMTFGLIVWLSLKTGSLYDHFLNGMSVNVAIMATGIFGLCINSGGKGVVTGYISKASFTVYLCHIIYYRIFEFMNLLPFREGMAWLLIPVVSLGILILSIAFYEALRRLKKLFHM